MKKGLQHIVLVCFVLLQTLLFSQEKVSGYRIEGDSIVFRFDKRDYEQVTVEKTGQRLNFYDFDINKVVVSGKFNNWSREGWQMKSINENIFELTKSLADIDVYKQEFKFFINDALWAEPDTDFLNIVQARTKNGQYYTTYNLNILQGFPKKDGNASFYLKGFQDASKVVVTGSFSRWNPDLFEMKKTKTGWKVTLELQPKLHQYRFVVDGVWMEDPANTQKVRNEFDGYNSVIDIQKEVTFFLPKHAAAKRIVLAGSFNQWNETELTLKKVSTGWKITLPISGGKHHYKFIVDGKWITDPTNTVREYDDQGRINSVLMVK